MELALNVNVYKKSFWKTYGSQSSLTSECTELVRSSRGGAGIIAEILSIADPRPAAASEDPPESPLDPEIPFRRMDSLANKSPMRSPPPPELTADCSFSAFFFIFLSLTLRSLALPLPPALRMDSIKEALPSEATAAGTSLGTAVIGAKK